MGTRFLTADFQLYRICTYRDCLLALPQLLLLPWLHRGRWGGFKGMPEGRDRGRNVSGYHFYATSYFLRLPLKKRKKKAGGWKAASGQPEDFASQM